MTRENETSLWAHIRALGEKHSPTMGLGNKVSRNGTNELGSALIIFRVERNRLVTSVLVHAKAPIALPFHDAPYADKVGVLVGFQCADQPRYYTWLAILIESGKASRN